MAVALKEWAIVCDALARGEQTILLRKGGLRDQGGRFVLEHDAFFLYPTGFHQNPEQVVPLARPRLAQLTPPPEAQVPISLFARVVAAWQVERKAVLADLADLHILAPDVVEQRFDYRKPGITLMLLAVSRLPKQVLLTEEPAYAGCHSWVELTEELSTDGLVPVLDSQQRWATAARLEVLLASERMLSTDIGS